VFADAVTVEYASLNASGAPITVPVSPYLSDETATIDVSTGVTYPVKAERARRNPKVALLCSDSLGPGRERAPVVLVQGLATVRDSDLQANTDRYVEQSMAKLPEAFAGQPPWLLRRSGWYFARIWIEVTPIRILWWPAGRIEQSPREWTAAAGTKAPPSDPAPAASPARKPAGRRPDWRSEAEATAHFPLHDLTVVDRDGFPLIVPVRELEATPGGFRFVVPDAIELPASGPACLTAHTHSVPFTSQQNRTFLGELVPTQAPRAEIAIERLLPDWSIPSGRLRAAVSFMRKGYELRPRLAAESQRRGQTPPAVRLPASS
jgi:hypothetical protein